MAALLTDRFRVVLAENFRSRVELGESTALKNLFVAGGGSAEDFPINLWLFFARSRIWKDVNNDPITAPNPVDNQEQAFNLYDQMLGLKKVESSDIRGVIRNDTWKSGTVYDVYRNDYGSETQPNSNVFVAGKAGESKLYETAYYVVTSEFKIYKCLDNNNQANSTIEPISISSAPFKESDGYVWKYMYSISASDFEKFKTDDYVPIPQTFVSGNEINPSSNFGGAVYNVIIESPGSGYTIDDLFDIKGDGTGGKVQVTSVGGGGELVSVRVINPGQSYTFGTVEPISNQNSGVNAQLQAIFSPKEGLARNIGLELGAYRLALNAKLNSTDFPFENDFSVVGLIYNPTIDVNATSTAIGTYKMKLDGPATGSPINDSIIEGLSSGATGKLIHYGQVDADYYIWYTQENIRDEGIDAQNQKIAFTLGEGITITPEGGNTPSTASIETVAGSISSPEITRGTGEIIYIDNRNPISRASDQSEDFKIILEF